MDLSKQLRHEIRKTIENSIRNFFENKEVNTTHVLDKIFPVERRIRSLIGGLETSMGTTLWEPLAKVLAKNNKFEIIEEEILKPEPIPELIQREISRLRQLRNRKSTWIPMRKCVKFLRVAARRSNRKNLVYVKPDRGKGVDIYLKKDNRFWAFDIKTNQPNVRSGPDFNLQLLEWYAFLFCKNPNMRIDAKIAFPFNPHEDDWWKSTGKRVFPLEPKVDAVVENEFWDFCSGMSNTFEVIMQVFEELGNEGFGNNFKNIFYKK